MCEHWSHGYVSYMPTLFTKILVDDNSTDGTNEVIQALRFTDSRIKPIYRTPPNGVGLAVRDGLRAATGAYVLSLDCDLCIFFPKFEICLKPSLLDMM